jgi:hypothetical protein
MMRQIFYIITLIGLLSACLEVRTLSEPNSVQVQKLNNYLQTAYHLTHTHKRSLLAGYPFVGMSLKEANLTLFPSHNQVSFSDKLLQARYKNRWGIEYILVFNPASESVIDWYLQDKIQLREPSACHSPYAELESLTLR